MLARQSRVEAWRARAAVEDPGSHQIAAALNTMPKYLASTTLTKPRRANTTLLSGDLAAVIGELKPSRRVSCRCTAAVRR